MRGILASRVEQREGENAVFNCGRCEEGLYERGKITLWRKFRKLRTSAGGKV
jgi:uncharacterized C2H2 Zn-finger protein